MINIRLQVHHSSEKLRAYYKVQQQPAPNKNKKNLQWSRNQLRRPFTSQLQFLKIEKRRRQRMNTLFVPSVLSPKPFTLFFLHSVPIKSTQGEKRNKLRRELNKLPFLLSYLYDCTAFTLRHCVSLRSMCSLRPKPHCISWIFTNLIRKQPLQFLYILSYAL